MSLGLVCLCRDVELSGIQLSLETVLIPMQQSKAQAEGEEDTDSMSTHRWQAEQWTEPNLNTQCTRNVNYDLHSYIY